MTLRGRLALVNVMVLLIALLLLAAIVLNQLIHDLYEQLDQELVLLSTHELTRVELTTNTPRFAASNRQLSPQMGLEGFARLLTPDGQITDGLGAYTTTPVLPQTLQVPPQGATFNQTNNVIRNILWNFFKIFIAGIFTKGNI